MRARNRAPFLAKPVVSLLVTMDQNLPNDSNRNIFFGAVFLDVLLDRFKLMVFFYTAWEQPKTFGFLMISRGVERDLDEMG